MQTKTIIKFLAPPFLIFFYQYVSALFSAKGNHDLKTSVRRFKSAEQGRRCFILATGPSISKQDLLPLKHELCISLSQFYLHPAFRIIAPKYHVEAPLHPPFDFEAAKALFNGLRRAGHLPFVFLGNRPYTFSYLEFLRRNPSLNNEQFFVINYFLPIFLNTFTSNKDKFWRIDKSPFQPRTSVYTAIQLAYYLGVKDVYLLGCDHDYLNDVNRFQNHHFYPENNGKSDVENLKRYDTKKWFLEYYNRWNDYELMDAFFRSQGKRIINATNGGMLDVFERVSYESLF